MPDEGIRHSAVPRVSAASRIDGLKNAGWVSENPPTQLMSPGRIDKGGHDDASGFRLGGRLRDHRSRRPHLCPAHRAKHPSTEAELTSSDGWSLDKHRTLARIIQRQIGVKDGWQAPRTAWGHAELAGAWTSDSVHGIPRERPVALGNRDVPDRAGVQGADRARGADAPERDTTRQALEPAGATARCAEKRPSD